MKPYIVYFSSKSNNTFKFVQKLDFDNSRIGFDEIQKNRDFILITPTYAGGLDDYKGAVPKEVIAFLNIKENREHCKAVISSGNTNFGTTYCIAGPIISRKLNIPLLYQFELIGTMYDVQKVTELVNEFWDKEKLK